MQVTVITVNVEELTQVHDSQLPTTLLQQGTRSLGNFRS